MAKPPEPESFEITEYGGDPKGKDEVGLRHVDLGVIQEIVEEKVRKIPSAGIRVAFTGKLVKLTYHCYEMHLPRRMQQVESDADTMLKEMIKVIKKEYKAKTGDTLKLKEIKELANHQVQKVSLNERYMYAGWRFFEI